MPFNCQKCHHKCKAECCNICPIPKHTLDKNKWLIQRDIITELSFEYSGHVPIGEGEHVVPITEDGKCCFLRKDLQCAIYEERPFLCRKFGDESHPRMTCRFQDKDGKERRL